MRLYGKTNRFVLFIYWLLSLLVAFFVGCFRFFVFVLCYRWTGSTTTTALLSTESDLSNENELQPLPWQLPIPHCAIVGFAKHLAVFEGCCAAFAPGCYVVGIHIGKPHVKICVNGGCLLLFSPYLNPCLRHPFPKATFLKKFLFQCFYLFAKQKGG